MRLFCIRNFVFSQHEQRFEVGVQRLFILPLEFGFLGFFQFDRQPHLVQLSSDLDLGLLKAGDILEDPIEVTELSDDLDKRRGFAGRCAGVL